VVAFARFANPITYSPANRGSVTDDIEFAYAERTPILVVDDQGDCISLSVNTSKSAHTATMQATFADSGTKYLNEVLPGDWVVAHVVYSIDELQKVSAELRAARKVNGWEQGMKFLGRVQSLQKRIVVNENGVPQSFYTMTCVAFGEFDSTLMYYPQLVQSDSVPVQMSKFGVELSDIIRGHESNEFGAIDINLIVPKLISVIFGQGAWASQTFEGQKLTPNLSYIVPRSVLGWLGIDKDRGTFADMMRVLVGVQKFDKAAYATNNTVQPGELFWPDNAKLGNLSFTCPFSLMGSFPAEAVPQTTTSPWAIITNYVNAPINEALIGLRADETGSIYPFFTLRQTPYTSEVGRDFDLATFQAEVEAVEEENKPKQRKPAAKDPKRAPTFTRLPTTRFLELPRWDVASGLAREATLGRSDMLRQNLVFVFGSGPGVPFNEYDHFVNSPPVKDNLDIYRNGIRPYMPSVNCFLRDLVLLPTDWRDVMSDIVMGQHLTMSGSLTISGVRAPIAPGENAQFEGVVYHIESVMHTCLIAPDGKRDFTTRLTLSRGVADRSSAAREDQFPNVHATDPEGPPQGVTKD
jgi:hypothetical protein